MHPNPINESHIETDFFDRIPDALVLLIFNQVSDIKTLTRCRSVSKRFNSLVPQADNLLVKVDCVISTETGEWFLLHLLKSILQSLQDLISPKRSLIELRNRSSPIEILRGFERIRRLEIELPSGDLRFDKGKVLSWKAVFGRSLKSCVILAVNEINGEDGDRDGDGDGDRDEMDFNGGYGGVGLKLRVVWTISCLIAASTRHYVLKEVIRDHREIESLVLRDGEGEGMVVMDKEEMREFREIEEEEEEEMVGWKNRTRVPAVRMRIRHEPWLDVGGGVRLKGATLVVVRPTDGIDMEKEDELEEDKRIASGAFAGLFEEAVEALLKRPSYLLEMNSF